MSTQYYGHDTRNFQHAAERVMDVTSGDASHHHWLSLLYGIATVSSSLSETPETLKQLFAGFLTDDVKEGIDELLQKSWMREDVANLAWGMKKANYFKDEQLDAITRWLYDEFKL